MEYYSAIKNNEFMKFLGKLMHLEDIILSEVTQWQKYTHDMHSLISGYKPRNLEYLRYNLQNTWNSRWRKTKVWILHSFLEWGTKYSMEGVTDTKFGAEIERRTIQRLPYSGIQPIHNHQTQTLLHMPVRFCWQDPDISLFCEDMPVPGKYRSDAHNQLLDGSQGPQWRS